MKAARTVSRRKNTSSRIGVICDPVMYAAWAREHQFCQVCGISDRRARVESGVRNSVHHVVKFRRSDERTNLLKCCNRCHSLCEGLQIRHSDGTLYPTLPLGVVLTVKRSREPQDFDAARLEVIYGRQLPWPKPLPWIFEEQFRRNRPKDIASFCQLTSTA
jgi:hypothetical protein